MCRWSHALFSLTPRSTVIYHVKHTLNTHTHTQAAPQIHLSLKLSSHTHLPLGLHGTNCSSICSNTHPFTHTHILCRHGGHWIIMLPPGVTDRCVSVCVCVCQAVWRPPFSVFISSGQLRCSARSLFSASG